MKTTAFAIVMFFVCLNVSLYIIKETQLLPYYVEPYEDPSEFVTRIATSLGILGSGALVAAITRNPWTGVVAISAWVGSILMPFFNWALFGFANFMGSMAALTENPALVLVVINGVQAMMAVVWFWFLLSMISQRYVET